MNISTLETLRDAACETLIEGGETLRHHYGRVEAEAEAKGDGDGVCGVVTCHDLWMERKLQKELGPLTPGIPFRGEELGGDFDADNGWLWDPIDGTMHFIRGDLPVCTSQGGLVIDGEVAFSAIHNFVTGDMYTAIRGQGAYHSNHRQGQKPRRMHVSNRSGNQAVISYESRLRHPQHQENRQRLIGERACLISSINSGHEMAMVADGKWEGRIVEDGMGFPWDYAPGSLIVKEAGGIVVNLGTTDYELRNNDFMAVNPGMHRQLTESPDAIFPVGYQSLR